MSVRAVLLGCVLTACSPFGGGAFECSLDTECSGGTCSGGYCSFPDPMCASGLRYGDRSGPSSGECVGGQVMDDGGVDAPVDVFIPDDSLACYGTGVVLACFTTPPTGDVNVTTAIDTASSGMCQTIVNSTDWCVIAGSSVTVTGTVAVTGSRPLVLVATGLLTVNGTLDVASKRGGQVGAAANDAGCDAGTAPSGANAGGAGGSFGGDGGIGAGTGAGTRGAAMAAPTSLRGGCPGQNGGGGAAGGAAGNGGGAVYLIADGSITVTGTINASGAGAGAGSNPQGGGGGAGAGGMIGLDAPTVTATGNIVANGGGGGEGGTAGGNTGDVGDDPNPATPNTPAAGGATSASGGDGGGGSAGATLNGSNGSAGTASGGGGGGGAGVIKLYRAASIGGGTVSPPPS